MRPPNVMWTLVTRFAPVTSSLFAYHTVISWFISPSNYSYKYHKPVREIGVIGTNWTLSWPGASRLVGSSPVSQDAKKIRATAPERLEAALRRRRSTAPAEPPPPAPSAGWAAARKAPPKAAPSNSGRGEQHHVLLPYVGHIVTICLSFHMPDFLP